MNKNEDFFSHSKQPTCIYVKKYCKEIIININTYLGNLNILIKVSSFKIFNLYAEIFCLNLYRCAGFLGMMVNISSIIGVVTDLLNTDNHPLQYVLMYKMSQDHLELFFNAVRRQGNYNRFFN